MKIAIPVLIVGLFVFAIVSQNITMAKTKEMLDRESRTEAPVTRSPVIETPSGAAFAADDYVLDGVFYIMSAADGKYIGVGGEKNGSSGRIGFYITMVSDKRDAIRFTPVLIEALDCRLQTDDVEGGDFYLDAFNSTKTNYGADLWGYGTDRDQRWLVERLEDGTYCIYLNSDPSLCLTYLPSDDSRHDDIVSVRNKEYQLVQKWYIVFAD